MKQLFYILICTFLLFACDSKKNESTEIEHIKINTSEKINFTDLFKDYHFIFPQANDSSLFGIEIIRMEKHKNRLYLLNQKQAGRNVLCFNTDGNFLFSIDRYGHGPGEYTYLGDFFIDTQINCIILAGEQNEWFYFNLDGKYLYSKKDPQELIAVYYTSEFNDSLYVSYRACAGNKCHDILFLDRRSRQIKYSIKSDPLHEDFTPSLPISRDKNMVFYYYSRNDTIYDISSHLGQRIPVCFADFGKEHQEFKQNLLRYQEKEVMTLFVKAFEDQKVRLIRDFLSNENYFAICYLESNPKSSPGVMYYNSFFDRQTKKSYNSKYIYFDVLNLKKALSISLLGCFDGFFYAVINSKFSNEELKIMASSTYLHKETKISLLRMDDSSNSIILRFK